MQWRFENFELDNSEHRLTREGAPVHLEKLPLSLLILLLERQPAVVPHAEIAEALWPGVAADAADDRIRTAMKKIRVALGDDHANPTFVEAVQRRGYRFKAPVTEVAPVASPIRHTRLRQAWWVAALATGALLALGSARFQERSAGRGLLRWHAVRGNIHLAGKIVSDGANVYWTETDGNHCRASFAPLGGGPPLAVPMAPQPSEVLDVTRDRRLLIVARETCPGVDPQGELWELALAGGGSRKLNLRASDAAYSRDGARIAFVRGQELWVAPRASAARRLAVLPAMISGVQWSPDDAALRVIAGDVFELALADPAAIRAIGNRAAIQASAWDARGDFWFVAGAERRGNLWKLSSRKPEQVTDGPIDVSGVAEVPGTVDLAVAGTRRQGALERYDSAAHAFAPYWNGASAQMLDFSRDGRYVAYVSYPDGVLWRARPDGSERVALTHEPLRVGLPRISPDGTRIAFSAALPALPLRLYTIPIDGGEPKLVMPDAVAPTWSPDGARLLYRRDNSPVLSSNMLQIVDLATGNTADVPGSQGKFNQRWSPNGKWIVATPSDSGRLELFEIATGRWRTLARIHATYPAWSPDSRFVSFENFGTHDPQIDRVEISSGRVESLARLWDGGNLAVDFTWGAWTGVTPSGDPLILRNADLQQIFLLSRTP